MSVKKRVLRAFVYSSTALLFLVLTFGAVLIALIVGDWILIQTGEKRLAWALGIFVMMGFLSTLGAGVGVWMWLRGAHSDEPAKQPTDTLDKLLDDLDKVNRD